MQIEAGVDWVTLSAPVPDDPMENGPIWQIVAPWFRARERVGLRTDEVSRRGYHGIGNNGLAYLENARWCYAEVPGPQSELALSAWAHVAEKVRVTRLDLQVTVGGDGVGTWWGRTAYAMAHHPADGRKRSVSDVGPPDGSYTVYVGSPSSDYLLRIYRKDKESPLENWGIPSWRYEMRIRKPYSQQIAAKLVWLDDKAMRVAIGAYLADELKIRGIAVPWPVEQGVKIAVPYDRKPTPFDKKLAWLETSVGPTVRELIGSGLVAETLKALGIAASSELARLVVRELAK